jgi:dephospho-CoA kinase
MIKIGLTGGIGSGKSTVASLFEVLGVPVYVADTESRRLSNTSPSIRDGLIRLFGPAIYTPEGVDRKRLASLIFSDSECLSRVNAIIHPEVHRDFRDWAARQRHDLCAIESAILFETAFYAEVDVTVTVYAPLEMRIERVQKRDGASREDILRRIGNQLPDEVKMERSDYVICNDDREPLIPQVENMLFCRIYTNAPAR